MDPPSIDAATVAEQSPRAFSGGSLFGGRLSVVTPALILPVLFGSLTAWPVLTSEPIPASAESTVLTVTAESTIPPTTGTSDDLEQLVMEFLGERDGGISVISTRDGTTTSAVTGVANAAGDPITADTPFRVGSISKPFVATMVLQLLDEGSVDLDETLSTYLPDTPIGGDVPIRMLLNHRSGLRNYTDRSAFIPDVFEDRNRVFTPDEILAWLECAVTDEPDQHFAYSNTNYILLGQLIEHLTGTDLDTAPAPADQRTTRARGHPLRGRRDRQP